MAQVVRPQGFIGPIVLLIVGVVLLINGVPALIQWIGWVAQVSLVSGVERAIEQAAGPLLLAAGSTFVGFLLLRGGWNALMGLARTASKRAQEQVRTGAQQVRREVDERRPQATGQAQHLQDRVPQSWRERIDAAAREVEAERARRSGQQPDVYANSQWQSPQGQQQRPQQAPTQQQPMQQPVQRPAAQQVGQRAPGADRLARIEQLRQQVDSRSQQAGRLQDSGTSAAQRVRQAAVDEAARVQQRQLPNPSVEVSALIGRLDAVDTERIRRRGSSLTSSSLSTSALSKTSLTLDSLLRHRR
ncbi:hypothetical protein [Agrococcus sp. Marseille-Q4369]|uniref:hypothetical protein n=1 Tax=Agrococcus sp. Marseille-Q4369 TaxID=2810513 RepID=UPI001B8D963C|nr:hypothetical protein [Agrococcus sp. Marseille-Q4369]QUW18326.1 hypothetical protein JSQ78_10895 [Agrococcus sp. Marseille-Q4369]